MEPVYKLGDNCPAISMNLHSLNRTRLCQRLQDVWAAGVAPTQAVNGVYVLLQGGSLSFQGGSDVEYVFRQVIICLDHNCVLLNILPILTFYFVKESYFHWAFGGQEPYWYGAIEVATQRSILFVPHVSDDEAAFMGEIPTLHDIKTRYGVDEVHYAHDVSVHIADFQNVLMLRNLRQPTL